MTALDHPTHVIVAPSRTVAIVERVENGLRAFCRALFNRRQVIRLAELSDQHLADIGLARADLELALNAPLGADPTAQLGRLAMERSKIMSAARHVC